MIAKITITSLFILLQFLFISCEKSTSNLNKDDTLFISLEETNNFDIENYTLLKNQIPQLKSNLNKTTTISPTKKIAKAKELFSTILVDSIFMYWKSTTWDFNGHTETPRNGDIACGYFVTTTLRDAGVKLNRIKLAQQASSVMIKELCKPSTLKRFANTKDLETYLSASKENEILIIGLDFHVGFVVKRNKKCYFIHSNYINRQGVIQELVAESTALKSSKSFMIGSITENEKLITNWLKN